MKKNRTPTYNRPIALGLIGAGRGGCYQLKEISSRTHLYNIAAIYDVDYGRAQRAAREFGGRAFASLSELLSDSDIELATIANRSTDHLKTAKDCLKAGKATLVEKPLCVSARDAANLARYARRIGGALFARHNRRFEPAFVAIQKLLKENRIGYVHTIKLRRGGYQRRDDWQTLIACGGGQGLNWGPHLIDQALTLLNGEPYEQWSDLKHVAALGDAEDHLKIILRGKQTGLLIDIEITGANALLESHYHVAGNRGALVGDDSKLRLKRIDRRQRFKVQTASSGTPDLSGTFGGNEEIRWVEETIKPATPKKDLWDTASGSIRIRRRRSARRSRRGRGAFCCMP